MNNDKHKIGSFYRLVLDSMKDASDAILEVYGEDFSSEIKSDGSPVTKADLASSKILHDSLSKINFPFLGEEVKKAPYEERKDWEYYWCVDPLDGTKEFIKKNDEFAICVALIHEHRAVFGAICSPVTKDVIFGGENFGVFTTKLDGIYTIKEVQPQSTIKEGGVTLAISRSHNTDDSANVFIQELKDEYGQVEFFSKGSALKFFDLAVGKADLYARFGPTMEWDIAAGHCILRELGGEILSVDENRPLTYNKESLYNPPFIAYSNSSLIKVKNA